MTNFRLFALLNNLNLSHKFSKNPKKGILISPRPREKKKKKHEKFPSNGGVDNWHDSLVLFMKLTLDDEYSLNCIKTTLV